MVEFFLLIIVIAVIGLIGGYALWVRAVPMPSFAAARAEILRFVPADPCHVTDLGAGWGDLVLDLAARRPDVTVTGIEISPLPFWISRMRASVKRLPNLILQRADFRKSAFDPGDVVLCYLDPRIMAQVGELLERKMAPGGIVISRAFAIPQWQPFAEIPVLGGRDRLFIYRINRS